MTDYRPLTLELPYGKLFHGTGAFLCNPCGTGPKPMQEDLRRIKALLDAHRGELQSRYGVRELALFGSRVRGEARASSDLDVLVEFDRPPGLLKFLELEDYLSSLLGLRVDLVRKAALRPELREEILEEALYL